jgi:hypothetical protein
MDESIDLVVAGAGAVPEGRTPRGRFGPGNPGKPRGSRRRVTVAMDAILERAAETMTERLVELASKGELGALKLCLERLSPPRRDAPVAFDLPPIDGADDTQQASSAILAAIAAGDLTPSEAQSVMTMLVAHKGIVEAGDHERRLAAIEDGMGR